MRISEVRKDHKVKVIVQDSKYTGKVGTITSGRQTPDGYFVYVKIDGEKKRTKFRTLDLTTYEETR